MKRKMFYRAEPLIFERAKELRNNLTHAEMMLWGYLRTNPSGYKFRRQHPVGRYVADFFCYKLKLVIEVDESIHNIKELKVNDEEREKNIRAEGLEIIRFTNKEILNELDKVIININTCINNKLTERIKKGMATPPIGSREV